MRAKNLAKYGVLCFAVGMAALALTFLSGFGPCGPATPLGGFLISLGFIATFAGLLMMVGAVLRAAVGGK